MQRFDIIANQNKGIQIIKNMTIYFIKINESQKSPYETLEERDSDGPKYQYFLHRIKKL